MLACPDMLFLTRHSVGREVLGPGVTRAEWRQLATKHQLQGVRTRCPVWRCKHEIFISAELVDNY